MKYLCYRILYQQRYITTKVFFFHMMYTVHYLWTASTKHLKRNTVCKGPCFSESFHSCRITYIHAKPFRQNSVFIPTWGNDHNRRDSYPDWTWIHNDLPVPVRAPRVITQWGSTNNGPAQPPACAPGENETVQMCQPQHEGDRPTFPLMRSDMNEVQS